jgi:hypothetical protein
MPPPQLLVLFGLYFENRVPNKKPLSIKRWILPLRVNRPDVESEEGTARRSAVGYRGRDAAVALDGSTLAAKADRPPVTAAGKPFHGQ